ncbi:MAG: prepilin-type N-terminal cleavage/methylation domain-containing protein [Rhodocyclales bacterium]|nr:prepilin-type N-terminal cleavage/methylation domain-containing protein [Rhodocyclales bacterium]
MSPASPSRTGRAVKGPVSIRHPVTRAIERGFTLVEMLVVLLIMGLLVGLVSASAQPDDRAVLRLEVDRLAQLMDLAATEAHLTGKAIAWTANGPAYRFWKFSEDLGWLPIVDDVLRARTLPQGMTISGMRVENTRSPEQMRVEFTPYGPAISFSIEMSLGNARYTLANSPIGDVRVLPEGGAGNEKSVRR